MFIILQFNRLVFAFYLQTEGAICWTEMLSKTDWISVVRFFFFWKINAMLSVESIVAMCVCVCASVNVHNMTEMERTQMNELRCYSIVMSNEQTVFQVKEAKKLKTEWTLKPKTPSLHIGYTERMKLK